MSDKKKIHQRGIHFTFWCPGCKCPHTVNTNWRVNPDNITISPSVLVTTPRHYADGTPVGNPDRCHSFVREGRIQYLQDCTHELRGQTVDIPEFVMDSDGVFERPEVADA